MLAMVIQVRPYGYDGEIQITTPGDRDDTLQSQLFKKKEKHDFARLSREWIARFYLFIPKAPRGKLEFTALYPVIFFTIFNCNKLMSMMTVIQSFTEFHAGFLSPELWLIQISKTSAQYDGYLWNTRGS